MDKELLESLKGKSREERLTYFNEHKSELLDEALKNVNGATISGRNPNTASDAADDGNGNYYSSFGWTCQGEVLC